MINIQDLWKFAKVFTCEYVSSEDIKKMRNRFKGKDFKDAVLTGYYRSYCRDWTVHHILPISLGGTNRRNNLAIVHPDLEKAIHEFIDSQEKPWPNRPRRMVIPVLNGNVWFPQQLYSVG